MRRTWGIIVLGLAFAVMLGLSGCTSPSEQGQQPSLAPSSGEEGTGTTTMPSEAILPSSSAAATVSPTPSTANPPTVPPDVREIIAKAKRELKIEMSKAEVQKLLGNNYIEYFSNDYSENRYHQDEIFRGEEKWKYEYKKSGYTFKTRLFMDEVDMDGLQNGNMYAQFFIAWNGDKLLSYTLYYLTESGLVEEYRVFPDGTLRVTTRTN